MALTDLLVHLDGSKACTKRIGVAQKLVEYFDAHITGLYIPWPVSFSIYAGVPIPTEVLDEAQAHEAEKAEIATNKFKSLTNAWDKKVSCQVEEGDVASVIIKHARCHDLVVAGQFNPGDDSDANAGVVDRVVLESGRPVLIVPYIGARDDIGKRIIIAWNGRREAVRAVHDALPLLKKADAVDIVWINPPKDIDIPCANIAEHLARHGVSVETHKAQTEDIDVGNLLLSLSADYDSDMIVMGAYGHSRYREMVLGGATRQVLNTMTIPVLMTH